MVTKESIINEGINYDLVTFILEWRWYFQKNSGIRRQDKLRKCIAEKFRTSVKAVSQVWTTDDFCKAYDYLVKHNMIKL